MGFRHGHSTPPVEVFYEPETDELILLDGMHWWRASLAYGFAELPCLAVTRERAEEFRGYAPRPQSSARRISSLCRIEHDTATQKNPVLFVVRLLFWSPRRSAGILA